MKVGMDQSSPYKRAKFRCVDGFVIRVLQALDFGRFLT